MKFFDFGAFQINGQMSSRGHVEIECAYTMFHLSHACHEKCHGQYWHDGYDNYYDPCDYVDNHWDGNDHWDDDHWDDDRWDDDHWDDDHNDENPLILWGIVMADNKVCFAFIEL